MKRNRRLIAPVLFLFFSFTLLGLTYKSWRGSVEAGFERVVPATVLLSNSQARNYVVFDLEDVVSGETVHNALGIGQPYRGENLQIDLIGSDFSSYAEISFKNEQLGIDEAVRLTKEKPRNFGEKKLTVTGFVVRE